MNHRQGSFRERTEPWVVWILLVCGTFLLVADLYYGMEDRVAEVLGVLSCVFGLGGLREWFDKRVGPTKPSASSNT